MMNEGDREAFLALIAPIGVDIDEVIEVLSEKISQIRYEPNTVRLTDTLRELKLVKTKYKHEVERYKDYITAGDKLDTSKNRLISA